MAPARWTNSDGFRAIAAPRPQPRRAINEHRHQRRAVVRRTPDGTRRPWKEWRDVWRESARGKRKPIVRVLSR